MTLHVVITDPESLDALPTGTWIGLVRRDAFVPYEKDYDGTWWARGGSYQLDTDHLVWGAMVLWVPGDGPYEPERGHQHDEVMQPWQHPGHRPVQHRDGKPPWCGTCGWTSPVPARPAIRVVDLADVGRANVGPAGPPVVDVPTGDRL